MIDEVHRIKDETSVPMVLIGNKCDLEHERQVTKEEGSELAERMGIQFFETSAKTPVNVTEALNALIRTYEDFSVSGVNENDGGRRGDGEKKCVIQ